MIQMFVMEEDSWASFIQNTDEENLYFILKYFDLLLSVDKEWLPALAKER